MKKNKTEIFAVRLPEDLKEEFEHKAEALHLNMGQIARKLIEDWVKTAPAKSKPFEINI